VAPNGVRYAGRASGGVRAGSHSSLRLARPWARASPGASGASGAPSPPCEVTESVSLRRPVARCPARSPGGEERGKQSSSWSACRAGQAGHGLAPGLAGKAACTCGSLNVRMAEGGARAECPPCIPPSTPAAPPQGCSLQPRVQPPTKTSAPKLSISGRLYSSPSKTTGAPPPPYLPGLLEPLPEGPHGYLPGSNRRSRRGRRSRGGSGEEACPHARKRKRHQPERALNSRLNTQLHQPVEH
jgi:hypothetical protein